MWHRSEAVRLTKIKKIRPERAPHKEPEGILWRQPLIPLMAFYSWNLLVGRHVRSSFVCARLSWFLHISALEAKDRPCAVQWCWSRLLEGSQNERVVGLSLLASSTARVSLGHPQSASIIFYQDVLTLQSKALLDAQGSTSSTTRISVYCPTFPATERNQSIRLRLLFYWHL